MHITRGSNKRLAFSYENRYLKIFNTNPDLQEFVDFLEDTGISIYGISLKPTNLLSLRRDCERMNIDVSKYS